MLSAVASAAAITAAAVVVVIVFAYAFFQWLLRMVANFACNVMGRDGRQELVGEAVSGLSRVLYAVSGVCPDCSQLS